MYKKQSDRQLSFEDFNQPLGLKMNPNNRWIKKSELMPWAQLEDEYAQLFESDLGNDGIQFQTLLGAQLIKQEYQLSDDETVQMIRENPYMQYFIGLPGYEDKEPFNPSSLTNFRKRLTLEMVRKVNDLLISKHEESMNEEEEDNDDDSTDGGPKNKGTLILDATCAPSNIKYPRDTELLNDSRIKAENIIDDICETNGFKKPRTKRRKAQKEYTSFSKKRRKKKKTIRRMIRKQLTLVKNDMKFIQEYLDEGIELTKQQKNDFLIMQTIYDQQKYMYDKQVHSVPNRIVSFHQPFLRPIVRGKVNTPVEFGYKLDVSNSNGFLRIEQLSPSAFNESEDLIPAVKRYCERNGYYPERILVDQIYRNRKNRKFCKEQAIRMSGPKLGRPSKNRKVEKKIEHQDNVDRIQIERDFSLGKRKHGLGFVTTKLESTTAATIGLAIVSLNLSKIQRNFLRPILIWLFGEDFLQVSPN
jgi:hypothetical protein